MLFLISIIQVMDFGKYKNLNTAIEFVFWHIFCIFELETLKTNKSKFCFLKIIS